MKKRIRIMAMCLIILWSPSEVVLDKSELRENVSTYSEKFWDFMIRETNKYNNEPVFEGYRQVDLKDLGIEDGK